MAASRDMPIERRKLFVPDLHELAEVLQRGLKICFETAEVNVVDCPDLTQKPFTLAAPGICGNPRLADVGGVPYLIPTVQRNKKYKLDDVARQVDLPGGFIIGAGAGPHACMATNCEMMANIRTRSDTDEGDCQTRIAGIVPDDGSYFLKKTDSRDFNLLANLLVSEGQQGKVLEVKCSRRRGLDNLVSVMQHYISSHYGKDKFIGLGGAFVIEQGSAKIHIMPDFSSVPLQSEEMVNKWLKFFDFKAPLICLSVFVTSDPGLDLRMDHTHCFSHHGQGGHYHYDITPQSVSYRGYFVPAEWMYRIDRPQQTHNIGRD